MKLRAGANEGDIRLRMMGLPVVRSLSDLAAATRLSKGLLYRLFKFTDRYYHTYELPKKSGGVRLIAQPSRMLKLVQWWLLRSILDQLQSSISCKGFEKGASIYDNAVAHVGGDYILNLDIEDFFPNIPCEKVWGVFHAAGYSRSVAALFATLCTFRRALPQGGPCSPKLANLVCHGLDNRLSNYCGLRGIVYTRYADDLTFSAAEPKRLMKAQKTIHSIVESEKLKINENKTRMAGPRRCRRVTGLVLTETGVGIGREKYREVRAKIFALSHCVAPADSDVLSQVKHLEGWLAFIADVDKKRSDRLAKYINKLIMDRTGSVLSNVRLNLRHNEG